MIGIEMSTMNFETGRKEGQRGERENEREGGRKEGRNVKVKSEI